MDAAFRIWKRNRDFYLDFFDNYSIQQLNKTPDGFNNNLIWNIGHVIVAQQALVYKTSNLQWNISDELYNQFKPGTKPAGSVPQAEVIELKELLVSLVEKTITDFNNGIFVSFNEQMTGKGFYLESLTDAVEFNNYHEGLHLGYMMTIKKFI